MKTFSLSVTNSAKEYFNNIRKNKSIKLGIKKSGCNGYTYILDLIDPKDNDLIFNSIPFSIEQDFLQALNECEIDYKENGFSSKIVFNNPNVVNSCGCGDSFSLKKEII
jgi:iron-sulfur cluster assembly accessory protein